MALCFAQQIINHKILIAEIRNEFSGVYDRLPAFVDAFLANSKELPPDAGGIVEPFIVATTLVKHRGFHEEREIRVVVSPLLMNPDEPDSIFYRASVPNLKPIRYRRKDDREIRYIELFGNMPLPIKYMIVGPSRFQNLNFKRIDDLVAGSGIDVIPSDTPFLG